MSTYNNMPRHLLGQSSPDGFTYVMLKLAEVKNNEFTLQCDFPFSVKFAKNNNP